MIRGSTSVRWAWGRGHAHGRVEEEFEERRTIDGRELRCNAGADTSADLVRQKDGPRVPKPASKVERAGE